MFRGNPLDVKLFQSAWPVKAAMRAMRSDASDWQVSIDAARPAFLSLRKTVPPHGGEDCDKPNGDSSQAVTVDADFDDCDTCGCDTYKLASCSDLSDIIYTTDDLSTEVGHVARIGSACRIIACERGHAGGLCNCRHFRIMSNTTTLSILPSASWQVFGDNANAL